MGASRKHYSSKTLGIILVIAGIIGLVASFQLTFDLFRVSQNPDFVPACSINPIINCKSVMETPEATTIADIPNSIFGIIGFSMLIAFGVIVATDVLLPRKLWQTAQIVATAGVIFSHFLMFSSVFALKTICPWCFVTWLVTILIFWAVTTHNAQHRLILRGKQFVHFRAAWQEHSLAILILWYGFVFALLLVEFWDYWSTLL